VILSFIGEKGCIFSKFSHILCLEDRALALNSYPGMSSMLMPFKKKNLLFFSTESALDQFLKVLVNKKKLKFYFIFYCTAFLCLGYDLNILMLPMNWISYSKKIYQCTPPNKVLIIIFAKIIFNFSVQTCFIVMTVYPEQAFASNKN
jgi:hypothetical protein